MNITMSLLMRGPSALENLFSKRISKSVYKPNTAGWYREVIAFLEKQKEIPFGDIPAYRFCQGYCCYQAALLQDTESDRLYYFEAALHHLQQMGLIDQSYPDIQHYCYLLRGILMQKLGHAWPQTEQVLLDGYRTAPARGEAFDQIIQHYVLSDSQAIAYVYTLYAVNHHYDRLPKNDVWGVDPDFYNWRILDLHATVSSALGKSEEAADVYEMLIARTRERPELFPPGEIDRLMRQGSTLLKTYQL